MAVSTQTPPSGAAGRRFAIGANVIVTIVLVAGIVAVLQAIAYSASTRWDMTSSRVNSLSEGTENLLRGLEANVRLSSLYFETDREEQDQQRYRQAARNLLDLYEATNRSRITADWINPLKNHEKLQALKAGLREKEAFKAGIEAYKTRVDHYQGTLDAEMKELVQSELELIGSLAGGIGDSSAQAVAPVENMFLQLSNELEFVQEQIEAAMLGDNPQHLAAVNELKSLYRRMSKALKDVGGFGTAKAARSPDMAAAQADFLRQAGNRYASLVADIEEEITKLQDLEPLKLDDLLRELGPTSNAILVETDADAIVVDFSSVWPPLQQGGGARTSFKNRAFKGEEKLTAAILRALYKEQTAVVFVRYGGQPLFMGAFMPGQSAGPYPAMKTQLEDANFIVEEWDLKSTTTPPKIDPAPTRTIYVVLKPTQPQRGPMGQPASDPPFTDTHKKALLDAMGDNPRALFIAGWWPGPFGMIPASYDYNEYLKENWGIELDTSALLMQTTSFAPGKYNVMRRDWFSMKDVDLGNHDIVRSLQTSRLALPWCAPLTLADSPPEGVELTRLALHPFRDGLWGVKSIQKYEDQLRQREYLTKVDEDLEGPFDLAVAAAKGDGKIVVVSSRDFATDNVAFAREMVLSAQGFNLRSRNPGNVALLVNSLHWLSDNTEFMNIGKPIDAAVLEVDKSTVKMVQALTIFVWPALALCCGGMAWWVRRR